MRRGFHGRCMPLRSRRDLKQGQCNDGRNARKSKQKTDPASTVDSSDCRVRAGRRPRRSPDRLARKKYRLTRKYDSRSQDYCALRKGQRSNRWDQRGVPYWGSLLIWIWGFAPCRGSVFRGRPARRPLASPPPWPLVAQDAAIELETMRSRGSRGGAVGPDDGYVAGDDDRLQDRHAAERDSAVGFGGHAKADGGPPARPARGHAAIHGRRHGLAMGRGRSLRRMPDPRLRHLHVGDVPRWPLPEN